MKKFNLTNIPKKYRQNGNFSFWISLIIESKKLLDDKKKKVLDFGCGEGIFLQLFNKFDKLENGIGLELNNKLVEFANKNNDNSKIIYKLYNKKYLKSNFYDVVFSQEVIYTIKDLEKHAIEIFKTLKNGGYYFATIGNYIENPLWSIRRKVIRKQENYFAYDYSINDIADIFYNVGFQVGLKRLHVEYPVIYEPKKTNEFSNSLFNLVNSIYDNKMLFVLWKPYV